jgi:hypothetical protein
MVRLPPRFAMTPPPILGGNPGTYEERLAQWFLEHTFFLDSVYRNQRGKGGKGELADAVVLHDDVVLMVQVKAQSSSRPAQRWGQAAIEEALRQLQYTNRMLFGRVVRDLVSATLGTIRFDPLLHNRRYGLILLAQNAVPYDPGALVPAVSGPPFPVHVLSLADFAMLTERFDTAADFISYLDFRRDVFDVAHLPVHREPAVLREIADRAGDVLRQSRPGISEELLSRSVAAFRHKASGELAQSPEWRFSLAIDDIIARLHERDPALSWNRDADAYSVMRVAAELNWLTRDRRITIGRRLLGMCEHATDGNAHDFSHYLRAVRTAFTFVATTAARDERIQYLQALTLITQARFNAVKVVGVATEPVGGGRSYDVLLRTGELDETTRMLILRTNPLANDDLASREGLA